ncbi:Multidrug resistance-associated protein 4 [Trachymyrmex zeteki]|uniref:Multidrug resistance-associated protein 4 n=1 Tax=Mycetomoellerius zeteki TaxID=64791 RepID=A0A151WHK6_9HYME|nr:PREDICTED: multidrug resistance-associated protein 4 [Trachymyrmex zeteki]KYQ47297.1 Multidrug resistance-associated protein 4 [Trachymyrmex zeteki]
MDAAKKVNNPNPRISANPISKLFFWWLARIIWYGKDHDLEMKNVYNIMPADDSEFLGNKLEENWKNEMHAAKKDGRKPKFFAALKKTFIWSFFYYGGWVLVLAVVVRTTQIYILGLFIWHFDPRAASTQEEAYLYASGIIILGIMVVMISHHSNMGLMEIGMRVRIASSSLIYRKILRLSSSTITTPGQVVNLLSNDMSKFEQLFLTLHYIWILPIQGSIIAFMIWQSVSIASLAGVFLIIIQTIPLQGYITKYTSKFRSKIAVRTDERIRLMSEIIKGIQVIKMYTWEKPFAELVNRARKYEINVLTLISYLRGFTLASYVFTERTTLYFTIMAYVLCGHSISADKVFSLAQYFNLLQLTMAIYYPMAVAGAAEAAVSIKRIENFLLLIENVPLTQSSSTVKDIGILMKNVSASWTTTTIVNTLHNINIQIKDKKLYTIIGPVGAGKSSFLQAILGELKSSQGQIHINGKISYASQEPWLFTGTVRNNILFGQPYDNVRYQNVVSVCALTKDFEQLPYGDKTLVGERGTALSGGQRARINLARAVYRDTDIYLFDDPLSAVDTHVGRHLFNECMNNYLRNKTRILVTHQLQYLKQCDYIVILNNGQIEDEGTFTALQEKHATFLEILMRTEEVNEKMKEPLKINANSMSDVTQNGNVNNEDTEKAEPQETEELLAKGSLSKFIYWKYLRSGASIIMIVCFLFCTILGQIGSNGCDYWVGYWTVQEETRIKAMRELQHSAVNNFTMPFSTLRSTRQIENASDINNEFTEFVTTTDYYREDMSNDTISSQNFTINNYKNIYYLDTNTALWIYGGFITISIVVTTIKNLIFFKICMNASKNLHNFMFSCVLKAPMSFFDNNPSGRILNRFSKDVGAVDEILPSTMTVSLQIFTVMIGILVQVFIINWWIIFAIIIMIFLFGMIRKIYLPIARTTKRLEGIAKSPMFSHVNSTLSGLTTIRSTGAQEMIRKQFDEHQDLHTSTYSLIIETGTIFGFALDIVSIGFIAVVTYSFVALNDETFAGHVGLAISQVLILCGMVQYGMRQTAETITQMTSVERIMQFTELEKEGPFESNPIDKPLSNWPSKGEIKFDRVYLRYYESEPPVLKSLSFVVEPGMKIGIVGRTGAGKSSLIAALFRMAKLDGTIYIDNVDTKKIGLHDLRNKISIIPQEPVLFSATLRDNLDPFYKFHDADLWSVLEEVKLKHMIDSLDYRVEQDGSNFSVGQRQLICLARAILQANKILVLDEATANVDPTTDAFIQATIRKKFENCTVLTIAHRLNTIMDNDKVLTIDQGQILEFDHPYILLQNEQGHFSSMVQETGKAMTEQLKQCAKEAYKQQRVL